MKYRKQLENILLSNDIIRDFYNEYTGEFKDWLDSLLPEINKCINQEQDNPWHKYNVMDHILHSVEEMNKQTTNLEIDDRLLLSYTMFFHDIGKPKCHIRRFSKGREIDSFFNHNIESEKVARRFLNEISFNKEDMEVICKLVFKHDIFMFIKDYKSKNQHWKLLTNNLVLEEIRDLSTVGDGEKLMRYLIMVGRSDNRAQNEQMTEESLKLLDKFDLYLDNIIQQKGKDI